MKIEHLEDDKPLLGGYGDDDDDRSIISINNNNSNNNNNNKNTIDVIINNSTSINNNNSNNNVNNLRSTYLRKVCSAAFYGVASFMITIVNKTVLTTYHFPSFMVLSLGQMTTSVLVLYFGKQFKIITYPNMDRDTPRKLFPLPLLSFGNMIFGLGGTQALSLPMFAALRRFSILMTMLLELHMLGIRPTFSVQISVYSMVGGALIAAIDDLSFNLIGYTFIMLTNILTACSGVFIKKKLETIDMGKYGLLYYNSLLMLVPAMLCTWYIGDIDKAYEFTEWTNPIFAVQFLLSCIMGFLLSYSTILCTQYNSALTTTIVGCLKNISVTYLGMFIGGDYIFSWLNWIGLNISIVGSLLYTYVTFRRKDTGTGGTSSGGTGSGGTTVSRRMEQKQKIDVV